MYIEEYNQGTGFYKAMTNMDGFLWGSNLLIAIFGCLFFFLKKILPNIEVPSIVIDYNQGFIVAMHATLVLVLNNGHNRYRDIYTKYLKLTTIGNVIDMVIKITLMLLTIIQIINCKMYILLCLTAYIFTFIRNKELVRHMDKENPLYIHILKVWIPNNIRHNVVMICFVVLFFVIEYKAIYLAVGEICGCAVDLSIFSIAEVRQVHEIISSAFLLFFDIYWIQRVLRKVKISKNTFLQLEGVKKLSEEMEKYYEKENERKS